MPANASRSSCNRDSARINGTPFNMHTHSHIRIHIRYVPCVSSRIVSREERFSSSGVTVVSRRATRSRWRRRAFGLYSHIYTCTHTYLPQKSTMNFRAITNNYWKLCVILAAIAGGIKGWQVGNGHKYKLTNTLIFKETESSKSTGDVGFRVTGELDITALWQDFNDPNIFLLKFEVRYISSLFSYFQISRISSIMLLITDIECCVNWIII